MSGTHRELRQARRGFVPALWPRRGTEHRFSWRRLSMVVDAGTPNVVSRSFFGTRVDVLAHEIQQATSDRAGDRARVTIYIYAIGTYLPAVPSSGHVFDFVVGRPVSYIDEDDAARILREEIDWLLASPWIEPHDGPNGREAPNEDDPTLAGC